ncbi:MAG: hypothetical protein ABIG11_04035 [bacterium]
MKNKLYIEVLIAFSIAAVFSPASIAADRDFSAFEQLNFQAQDMGLELPAPGTPEINPPPAIGADDIIQSPGAVGEVLNPRFLELGEDIKKEAVADWKRRLKANGGKPSIAPLTPINPSRNILLCIPGHGGNFQDMHTLAKLEDTYQVLIAVANEDRSIDKAGKGIADIADAVMQFMDYRRKLGLMYGMTVSSELRLVGHSMGGGISQLLLQEHVDRKKLYDGPGSIFLRVIFIGMDSIWRGVDLPWAMLAPGIKELGKHGITSLMNRGAVMNRMQRVSMPDNVTTHFITIHHDLDTRPGMRSFEPIANWYSNELGRGELKKLWDFLRKGKTDLNELDGFAMGGLIRKQGLQNLWRTLARDADYSAHEQEIRDAAVRATTKEEFAAGYDAAVAKIVDTFGTSYHTEFMWKDPAFLPWIRIRLNDWDLLHKK